MNHYLVGFDNEVTLNLLLILKLKKKSPAPVSLCEAPIRGFNQQPEKRDLFFIFLLMD